MGGSRLSTDSGDDALSGDETRPDGQSRFLEREVEFGNVEYKLKLIDPSVARTEELVTQLKWRLAEGSGRALYKIGVGDDGSLCGIDEHEMEASLATLSRMCAHLDAQMLVLSRRMVTPGCSRSVVEVLVQAFYDSSKPEARVAFVGDAQTGKSTLLGVLATGMLDNGQGSARTAVMRHVHELESGSTSCISQQANSRQISLRTWRRSAFPCARAFALLNSVAVYIWDVEECNDMVLILFSGSSV